jgi:hypothetical protein
MPTINIIQIPAPNISNGNMVVRIVQIPTPNITIGIKYFSMAMPQKDVAFLYAEST